MRTLLAGVIQGSKKGKGVVSQDYRGPMKAALFEAFPGAEIFNPVEHHPKSVHYPDPKGRAVFRHLMREAARFDVLAAFLPEASMGTAIEIREAKNAGRFVAAVTPMDRNWVVRYLCDRVYPDLAAFASACRDGTLRAAVLQRAGKKRRGDKNPPVTTLCGLTLPEFEAFAVAQAWPKFRGRQISEWIFRKGADAFEAMTNLPKEMRERLPDLASVFSGAILEDPRLKDGTRKLLLGFGDDARIECVAIPDEDRLTFCLSSQSGCPIGCAFCATGQGGFVRNLAASEILEQFLRLQKACGRPTNVVFMGMGEPLLNLDAVAKAIEILNDDRLGAVGSRRMTLSTVGLPDLEDRLRRLPVMIHLAISLHAANDEARKRLVPSNPVGGIAALVRTAKWYLEETGREVTFEYTLLAGVNDSDSDARALADLLAGVQSRVNLIPYNASEGQPFHAPYERNVLAFEGILRARGLNAMIRKRRGEDIAAACGQLALRRGGSAPTSPPAPSSPPEVPS